MGGLTRIDVRIAVASLLLIVVPTWSVAQDVVTVSGTVTSAIGHVGIPGAVVANGPTRVTTDADGAFVLTAPPGPLHLAASAAGFLDQAFDLVVRPGMPPVELALARAPIRENVDVSAEGTSAASTPSAVTVPPTAVLQVAGAGDNIFKALQTLPGINATDDFGSRLAVRGGGPDQNLTVMDGVEIHNPYRLFGLTSAFNPETVDRFELTAGGFGVEYGDRLSSILLVENRAGVSDRALGGSAAISLTDANIVFEGRLPGRPKGSWLVTGRRTYYDLVANKITGNDLPSFNDLQTRVVWDVKPGHTITLFGLRSREHTNSTFTSSGDSLALGDASTNDVVSLAYRAVFGPRASASTIVSWYNYGDTLDVDGAVKNNARRSNAEDEDAVQHSAVIFTRGLGVRDVSARQQFDLQTGRHHLLGAGFDVHALRTSWDWEIAGDRNGSVANGSSIRGGAGLPSLLASSRDTIRAALWINDRIAAGRVHLEPGLRIDHSGLSGEVIASPRLAVDFAATPDTHVKAAVGRFTQSPGYEKLLQSDYFVDLTSDGARLLRSEDALHVIAGLEHAFTASVTGKIEAYDKQFDQLIVGRLETPAETAARVATYDFPPELANSIPTSPQITSLPVNGASGQAYGFDVYVEKRQRSSRDRLSGWASYTWGKATLVEYGIRRPFDYDRRHAASVVSTLELSRRLDFSSTLRVASGFPATAPIGVVVAADPAPDGSGRLVPAVDAQGRTVWTTDYGNVSNLGRSRLPVYARLDLRLTFKPKSPTGRWQLYFEVINALNRKNVSALQPQLNYDPSSDRPSISYRSDSGLPLLPSFGFRYRY
jgi:hypothetical protein